MKTIFLKSLLLPVILFIAFNPANANVFFIGKTQVGIKANAENSRLNVKVANIGSEALILTVYNLDKEVLFKESLNGEGQLNKTYDLRHLPDGEYFITFRKPFMETLQPFTINKKMVTVLEGKRVDRFMPEIRLKRDQLKVNLLLNNFSTLQVFIYDKYGRQILAEELEKSIAFNRQYDLSKLESGQYTVELRTGTEIFRRNFEVK